MKYYSREITKRESINRFGKLGFIPYIEYIKTNDIEKYNKNKKIKFSEISDKKYLLHKKKDIVYSEKKI